MAKKIPLKMDGRVSSLKFPHSIIQNNNLKEVDLSVCTENCAFKNINFFCNNNWACHTAGPREVYQFDKSIRVFHDNIKFYILRQNLHQTCFNDFSKCEMVYETNKLAK